MSHSQCIICSKNSEKLWPKRWQCWKENGKFSESLCKLLGLPENPYKDDFQKSEYCSSCQRRVYDIYLTVRKWDKLHQDISKLKSQLENDFHQALKTGKEKSGAQAETSKKKEKATEGCSVVVVKQELDLLEGEEASAPAEGVSISLPGRIATEKQANNRLRRKILKKLSSDSHVAYNEGSNFRDSSNENKKVPVKNKRKKSSHIEYSSSSSESESEHSFSSLSYSDNNFFNDGDKGDCSCNSNSCFAFEKSVKKANTKKSECSTKHDYCADCTICKDESKRKKKLGNNTENIESTIKMENSPLEETAVSGESVGQGETINYVNNIRSTTSNAANSNSETATSRKRRTRSSKSEGEERLRCNLSDCIRSFRSRQELEIHIKRHHEGVKCPYVCQECGQAFQWSRELNAHVLKHSGEVAFPCAICGKGFRTKLLYDLHMKSKHSEERQYKCSFCEKSFITESKLKAHETSHTKVYPHLCHVCGKGFSATTFLAFHMTKHMEANPLRCSICGKCFASPKNLRDHQYIHTMSHPFKCSICNAGSATEASLKLHMMTHSDEMLFSCSICNKKFRFSSSLNKHRKTHQNLNKPYVCEICDKGFMEKYKLARHIPTHSKEKPDKCPICSFYFTTKDILNTHLRKHEGSGTNMDRNRNSSGTEESQTDSAELSTLATPENNLNADPSDTEILTSSTNASSQISYPSSLPTDFPVAVPVTDTIYPMEESDASTQNDELLTLTELDNLISASFMINGEEDFPSLTNELQTCQDEFTFATISNLPNGPNENFDNLTNEFNTIGYHQL